jgi:hypothetical protein
MGRIFIPKHHASTLRFAKLFVDDDSTAKIAVQ